jgi:hypothetical protein
MTGCTIAAITAVLGYTPSTGSVVEVPAAIVAQHSRAEIAVAKACASRHGIRWRIVNGSVEPLSR